MSDDPKDTIYIDVDDEITSIIDKVSTSKKKIVALVLPKRATVFQSIVNMRLLKRSADGISKKIVLITSESSILPLAGVVGVHVARTLQSKPAIPANSETADEEPSDVEVEDEAPIDPKASVGELAGLPDDEEAAIEVDNVETEPDEESVDDETPKPVKKGKSNKKNRKFKIPNFDTFRKKLFLGAGLLILLVVGWYVAFFVMPTAKITLKTDTTSSAVDITFTASPTAKELNEADKIVPAVVKEIKKDNTQKVTTTGEKNLGDKAKGTVTMTTSTNCLTQISSVPGGTTVSSSNLNFITQEVASFTSPPDLQDGKCIFTSNTVAVNADLGGGNYNLSARAYSVSNFANVTANGSNMTGGTDKIVKIVAQSDIDGAKQKALEGNSDAVKAELSDVLKKEGYVPITDTFGSAEPVATPSVKVGDEATEVSVKVSVSNTMLGIQKEGLKKLIESAAKKQIDTNKQTITDDGLSKAAFQVFDRKPNGETRLSVQSTVVAGAQLDANAIKQEIAGKRRGEVQKILDRPGVKDIDIVYSPVWVTKTPKNQNKITIVFENAGN